MGKLLSFVSIILSCVFLVDMISWLVSGTGLGELITGGTSSPLVISLAERITVIPDWAFYFVCALSVIVLSLIMTVCAVTYLAPNNRSFKYPRGLIK